MVLETSASAGGKSDEGRTLPQNAGDVNRVAHKVRWARGGIIGDGDTQVRAVVVDPNRPRIPIGHATKYTRRWLAVGDSVWRSRVEIVHLAVRQDRHVVIVDVKRVLPRIELYGNTGRDARVTQVPAVRRDGTGALRLEHEGHPIGRTVVAWVGHLELEEGGECVRGIEYDAIRSED